MSLVSAKISPAKTFLTLKYDQEHLFYRIPPVAASEACKR